MLSNGVLLLILTLKHELMAYVFFQIRTLDRTADLPKKISVVEAWDAYPLRPLTRLA